MLTPAAGDSGSAAEGMRRAKERDNGFGISPAPPLRLSHTVRRLKTQPDAVISTLQ